jgi:uncharacterized protein YggT (Ycf19 family)
VPGPVRQLLAMAIWVLIMTIMASIVISWLRAFGVRVPRYNPLIRAIEDTADLVVRPIRRSFPTAGGGLDFAPMIALMILYILQAIIARL